jgi:hypothetical protein
LRLPRDVSGDDLAKALADLGDAAQHFGLTREALAERLFAH